VELQASSREGFLGGSLSYIFVTRKERNTVAKISVSALLFREASSAQSFGVIRNRRHQNNSPWNIRFPVTQLPFNPSLLFTKLAPYLTWIFLLIFEFPNTLDTIPQCLTSFRLYWHCWLITLRYPDFYESSQALYGWPLWHGCKHNTSKISQHYTAFHTTFVPTFTKYFLSYLPIQLWSSKMTGFVSNGRQCLCRI